MLFRSRQVDQEEDEEGLDDAHLLGEARDEGQDDSEDQTHQGAPDTDDKEGSWGEMMEGMGETMKKLKKKQLARKARDISRIPQI